MRSAQLSCGKSSVASIDALVQIERTRVQIQETLLELRLDEARRLADLDALTAVRLAGAD